jgi:adenylate cyclase
MRAGTWSTNRNIAAAHTSWRRARQVADRLSEDDPDRLAMRIAPRTLLCGSAWRVGGSGAETGFDELRELCTAAGDQRSLAIGMFGLMLAENMNAHPQKASRYATELAELLESIGGSTLTVALLTLVIVAKRGAGEIAETLKFAQRVIDLADDELTKGNLIIGSPLASATAMRGMAGWCMGLSGWKSDLQQAIAMTRALDPMMLAGIVWYVYVIAIPYGCSYLARPLFATPRMLW